MKVGEAVQVKRVESSSIRFVGHVAVTLSAQVGLPSRAGRLWTRAKDVSANVVRQTGADSLA